MPLIYGSFPNLVAATAALQALRDEKIPHEDVSFVSRMTLPAHDTDNPAKVSAHGMGTSGMVAAIATGVLAGGMAATGVGLFVAGPIAAALAGLGTGGMAGTFIATLAGAGVAKEDAVAVQDELFRGRVIAIVEVNHVDVERTREVFDDHGALDEKDAAAAAKAPDPNALEGEGSYTAARRYDEGAARTAASGDVERLAREAANALDDPAEGPGLKDAVARASLGRPRRFPSGRP